MVNSFLSNCTLVTFFDSASTVTLHVVIYPPSFDTAIIVAFPGFTAVIFPFESALLFGHIVYLFYHQEFAVYNLPISLHLALHFYSLK